MCKFYFRLLILSCGLLILVGCGDGTGRVAVSGNVLFKGQPLDQGRVHFVPTEKLASEGGATVKDGKFEIPRDRGMIPGSYKVSVWSYDQKGAKVQSEEMPGDSNMTQFKERIPAKYNVKTTLTADVKSSGSNHFEFKVD